MTYEDLSSVETARLAEFGALGIFIVRSTTNRTLLTGISLRRLFSTSDIFPNGSRNLPPQPLYLIVLWNRHTTARQNVVSRYGV